MATSLPLGMRLRGRAGTLGFAWTAVVSLGLHGAAVVGVGWLALHSFGAEARNVPRPLGSPPSSGASPVEVSVTVEGMAAAGRVKEVPDPVGDPPTAPRGPEDARLDQERGGRGGDGQRVPAVNLADTDDRVVFTTDLVSHLDRDQEQRLRTAGTRASREDRRSTLQPMELTFLASGSGDRAERRAPSAFDPSRGAKEAAPAEVRGSVRGNGAEALDGASPGSFLGGPVDGTLRSSPGTGVRDGRPGADHRASAAVTHGRPAVPRAAVAVAAAQVGRPSDTVDSEQQVAKALQSLVRASTAGGATGVGGGGSRGGGTPGAGGPTGEGSKAQPLGLGDVDAFDADARDPQVLSYFRQMRARLAPAVAQAVPDEDKAAQWQGTVILDITLDAEGHPQVAWPPHRPSGLPVFDRNCAEAVRRVASFGPLPASLGRSTLRLRAPLTARNPVIW